MSARVYSLYAFVFLGETEEGFGLKSGVGIIIEHLLEGFNAVDRRVFDAILPDAADFHEGGDRFV